MLYTYSTYRYIFNKLIVSPDFYIIARLQNGPYACILACVRFFARFRHLMEGLFDGLRKTCFQARWSPTGCFRARRSLKILQSD